jgi:hypothetical protein
MLNRTILSRLAVMGLAVLLALVGLGRTTEAVSFNPTDAAELIQAVSDADATERPTRSTWSRARPIR